jgi:hypothetical protein
MQRFAATNSASKRQRHSQLLISNSVRRHTPTGKRSIYLARGVLSSAAIIAVSLMAPDDLKFSLTALCETRRAI